MKICTKCKMEKDESEFHKNKNEKDGYNYYCKKCFKEYCKNNKEKYSRTSKKWKKNNKQKYSKYQQDYREKHKEEIKIKLNKRRNDRKQRDPCFKLKCNISTIISKSLKNNNSNKRGISCLEYLDWTPQDLRKHLELQFEDWMNWDNYGPASTKKRTWNIDHIIPQSLLPYTSMEDENFKKCWSLENLRPLESIINIKKSNKIIPT